MAHWARRLLIICMPVAVGLMAMIYSPTSGLLCELRSRSRGLLAALERLGVTSPDKIQLEHDMYIPGGCPNSGNDHSEETADVTAVILNWSRLSNVIQIVESLCHPGADDTIAAITVWNNNPISVSHSDFAAANCSTSKLRIYNSPENVYFQARFIACSQANTPYCFIQDDDYFVYPEIIRAIRHRMDSQDPQIGVHLLPPHEMLSSRLRRVYVGSEIHTSFAWLGHGALIPRVRAVDFLALMSHLNASEDEIKMADNYYTILANTIPETWFDQGVELGGGQPFTVGAEGDERNKRHILRAAGYLEHVLRCTGSACMNSSGVVRSYVTFNGGMQPEHRASRLSTDLSFAASRYCSLLLVTSIALLQGDLDFTASSPTDILRVEKINADKLGTGAVNNYVAHSLSLAVDGDTETAFRSAKDAMAGDFLRLMSYVCGGFKFFKLA
ncbi:hypothetical protein HGRIS_008320 [Hohenbuehelia grisea]|uniref:Glycosyl transferase 64 domain-containing protein n=1 Tax=Hohenbuehelia grisea TaxID=104357 RepID=A0ABR3J927_9AGAR